MRPLKLLAAALVAALTATAAYAHHSFAMFDRDTQLVKTGTVVRWAFNNPHSWLYMNVKNPDGSDTLWSFEGSAPTGLITTVTFMFCPLKDGRPGGAIGWAKLDDGKYLNPADGGCNGGEENQKKWQTLLQKGITSSKNAETASAK